MGFFTANPGHNVYWAPPNDICTALFLSLKHPSICNLKERERYLQEAVNGVLKSNSVLADMEFQAKRNLETKNREIRSFQVKTIHG